jgi:hypothetical protein
MLIVRRIRVTSDNHMSASTPQSRRVVFWVCFLAVAGVCLALALSGQNRRSKAYRTVEMLRSILSSDPRFKKVTAAYGTNGSAWLHGSVASEEDLRALRTLVEKGHLPMQPGISVQVESHPSNTPAAGKAGIAPVLAFLHHRPGLPEPGRSA